jgi:hypothetical protein
LLSASPLAGTLTPHRNPNNLTRHGITSFGLLNLAVKLPIRRAKRKSVALPVLQSVITFTQ